MVNIDVAKQVRDLIELHPEQFDMLSFATDRHDDDGYICGTTACLAGHAAILTDRVKVEKDIYGEHTFTFQIEEDFDDWENAGRRALGIGEELASYLFFTNNTKGRIGINMLADGEGEDDVLDFLLNTDRDGNEE